MIFENESNWNTEDLWSLVEYVKSMPGYREGYNIYPSTLLLVRTSSGRPTKNKYGEISKSPLTAEVDRRPSRWEDTVVVKIRSKIQLKMDVLDRIAHIGEMYEQDMSGSDVVQVAKAFGEAIASYSLERASFEWARTMSLRSRYKIEVGKVALLREIEALDYERRCLLRKANEAAQKIDHKMDKLKSKL